MTSLVDSMIERINAAVDVHNQRLQDRVDSFQMPELEAAKLRVPAGAVTRDTVRIGPAKWPVQLRWAVQEVIVNEDPCEIVRLCDACSEQTETIKHLRYGAAKSLGFEPGDMHGYPVGIRLIDMAHLVMHSGAERAILLG